jgi:hypothetical protein
MLSTALLFGEEVIKSYIGKGWLRSSWVPLPPSPFLLFWLSMVLDGACFGSCRTNSAAMPMPFWYPISLQLKTDWRTIDLHNEPIWLWVPPGSIFSYCKTMGIKLNSPDYNKKKSSKKKQEMSDRDLFHAVVFTSVIQLHFIPNCWWVFSTASLLGASKMQKALFSSLL